MSATVLIVDDEVDLVDILEHGLQKEGLLTQRAYTGAEALEKAFGRKTPDLILLDLMLPDIGGVEICRRIRAHTRTASTPIIMLTARDTEIDRVVGFEVGADDYVTKPFSVRELLLRVHALLRRSGHGRAVESKAHCLGALTIDEAGHRASLDGEELNLTSLEFRLLTTLVVRRGRVQRRDVLLRDVWGMRPGVTTRTVDTHITRLRRKLGAHGFWLETRRGIGYVMRDSPPKSKNSARWPDPAGDPTPS